jgi:F-type H+-transporting ATPase subunit b
LNYATPEFWVFIAFVLFLGAVGKRAFVFLTQSLDEYSRTVARQLEEAQRLHDEALSLLNSYKKKHEEAIEQAAKIVSYAEAEALEFKKSSEEEFEKFMANKEKALAERLVIEKEEAKSKLRQQAVDEAFTIVEKFLSKELKEKKKLTEASLKEVSKLVKQPTGMIRK